MKPSPEKVTELIRGDIREALLAGPGDQDPRVDSAREFAACLEGDDDIDLVQYAAATRQYLEILKLFGKFTALWRTCPNRMKRLPDISTGDFLQAVQTSLAASAGTLEAELYQARRQDGRQRAQKIIVCP